MILVTLGTQKQPFTRLLDYIENSSIEDEIIVQAGHTKYTSKKMKIFSFIDYSEMSEYIKKADLIITHGGTGSIITPLKEGKKIIACARQEKYGEHVDNHQNELVDIFADEGYILKIEDDNLDEIYEKSKKFKPKKYKSNTENFKKQLKIEIEKEKGTESILILVLFILFLFLAAVFLILRPQKEISDTENRELNKIDLSLITKFKTGEFQDNIEKALPDQIILSQTLKKVGNNINKVASKISLNTLYDYKKYDVEPYAKGIYRIKNTDYLIYGESELEKLINSSKTEMSLVKIFAEKNPTIKTYIYKINREMDFKIAKEYDHYFINFLDDKVKYKSFSKISSYEDYQKYFYKSDHHMNNVGQYEIYKEIIELMGNNKPIEIEEVNCFNGVQFRGSKARTVGDMKIRDDFCVNEYNLPSHYITVAGKNINMEQTRNLYREHKMPLISDISHYSNYYGLDYGEIIYTYVNNMNKPNLLMVVDSYSNPINELISADYYRTYIVDLRDYQNLTGKKFNIYNYVKEKNISEVLILGNINLFIESTFYIN